MGRWCWATSSTSRSDESKWSPASISLTGSRTYMPGGMPGGDMPQLPGLMNPNAMGGGGGGMPQLPGLMNPNVGPLPFPGGMVGGGMAGGGGVPQLPGLMNPNVPQMLSQGGLPGHNISPAGLRNPSGNRQIE